VRNSDRLMAAILDPQGQSAASLPLACYGQFSEPACGASAASWSFRRSRWREAVHEEDYLADFLLPAKHLKPLEQQIFKFHYLHYLLGADWKLCSRKLGMDRGNFFHACYRIEEALGEAYALTEPYKLFPIDEYFGRSHRSGRDRTRRC
jgi:hypothetical protein